MNHRGKIGVACAIVILVLTMAVQGVAQCTLSEPPEKQTALKFLEKVVGVDLEIYTLSSFHANEHPRKADTTSLKLVFEEDGGKIEVLMEVKQGYLTWCSLTVVEGTLKLTVPYSPNLTQGKNLFNRYRAHFNVPYCDPLIPLLDQVEEGQNQTVFGEHVVLRVKVQKDYLSFSWTYRVNGIEAPKKAVSFGFRNGFFRGFVDDWNIYEIGSTTVTISEKEAKTIAVNEAQDLINEIGAKVTRVEAELTFYNDLNDPEVGRESAYTLYPAWGVELFFDKTYPQGVTGYYVGIWADTGEVYHAGSQGILGSPDLPINSNRVVALITLPFILAFLTLTIGKRSKKIQRFING